MKKIEKDEYDYDFLDYEYWKCYNINPFWHHLINEQFEAIRKAFRSLDENTKNILDCFIIRKIKINNVEVDMDKYIEELKRAYYYFYNKNEKDNYYIKDIR